MHSSLQSAPYFRVGGHQEDEVLSLLKQREKEKEKKKKNKQTKKTQLADRKKKNVHPELPLPPPLHLCFALLSCGMQYLSPNINLAPHT